MSPNVIIGRYCSISHFVNIGAIHHNYSNLTTSFGNAGNINDGYTVIECDVWIGINATILGGAKIGYGAVIGSGAVVKNNLFKEGDYNVDH